MAQKKCDWCGRYYTPSFSADRDMGNTFMDAMGLSIVTKAIGGAARLAGKRNFCSKQCKLAYEQSKNGGATGGSQEGNSQNSGGGIASGIGSLFSSTTDVFKDELAQKKQTRSKTDDIVNLQFESSVDGIQNQLQNLFTQISALPKLKTPEQKSLYNAIKEKIEFGIMKLKSNGANTEADFFQNKFSKLK